MSSSYYTTFERALPLARSFIDFVNKSKSPWHAVNTVRETLEQNGYKYLSEAQDWKSEVRPKGKYYFTRNQSTIVAFAVGAQFSAGNGIKVIGAHTDSPDLKIKPISAQNSQGYLQVGVQTYGGGLWYSWFDRDLTVAGRAVIKTDDDEKPFQHRLFEVKKPILRIPSLAIHLNRTVNDEGFKFSKEKHLVPVLATAVKEQLESSNGKNHHPLLMDLIAKELHCNVEDIKDFELSVCDYQPSIIGGINDEFIFSPRLDNLMSCFCALESLIQSDGTLQDDKDIRVVALFDHEEIGSGSSHGAASSLMSDIFQRLNNALAGDGDFFYQSLAKSYIISSDMAHAVHPGYPEKHQEKHRPTMHMGPVVKVNTNQRYATNAVTSFVLKELAKRNNIPLQEFVVSNDTACGSTIGPILASRTGVRVLDLGIPQLSMHSIREQCGTIDVVSTVDLFNAFWTQFREIDDQTRVD